MNGKRPSPRTIRLASAGTAAAALLAAFAAVAGAGLSSNSSSASEYEYGPGSHQYGHKVTLCHHTHSKKHPAVTITVGAPAVAAHLKKGDNAGACPAPPANGHHGKDGGDDSSTTDKHGSGNQSGSDSNGNSNNGHDNNGHDNNGHGNNGHGHGK